MKVLRLLYIFDFRAIFVQVSNMFEKMIIYRISLKTYSNIALKFQLVSTCDLRSQPCAVKFAVKCDNSVIKSRTS